jgi:hypothetical protein
MIETEKMRKLHCSEHIIATEKMRKLNCGEHMIEKSHKLKPATLAV